MGFGPMELMIILVIVVVIFGASRLTNIGSALGQSIREFKHSVKDDAPVAPVTPSPAPQEQQR